MILSTDATVTDLAGDSYTAYLMEMHGWTIDDLIG